MPRRPGPDDSRAPLAIGQSVLVIALKRHGAIVGMRGQQYRVAVGGLTLTCERAALRPAQTGTRRHSEPAPEPGVNHGGCGEPGGTSSIDLHGLTVDEARSALLAHVDAALRAGRATVEVVHGIGTGRVRAAVLDTLAHIPSVRAVKPHPTNRGVTLALL